MGLLFQSDFHDEFGTWPLGYIPTGGLDFGEVFAVAQAVGEGDDSTFYEAWVTAAARLNREAEAALAAGNAASARALFLKASCAFAAAYHPIYGAPVDPRLVVAFQKQTEAFDQAMRLSDPPVAPTRIPFEETSLPAYLIPAEGCIGEVRPLLIFTNGYDASITDLYFASAVAASRRGYHCLLFDGPGQGGALIEQGLTLRPDWENVVKAVVGYAVTQPIVDPRRIAISGWSLGGYLAPRAASGEPRLAACIADPGQPSVADGFRRFAMQLGAGPESVANLGEIDSALLAQMEEIIAGDRKLRWMVRQRGFWVNGVDNFRDYLRSVEAYTMQGRTELIRCPTLVTQAENDMLAFGAQAFYDALQCPKQMLRFTAAEGAGDHCQMMNRSLFNQRALDWLDDVLA